LAKKSSYEDREGLFEGKFFILFQSSLHPNRLENICFTLFVPLQPTSKKKLLRRKNVGETFVPLRPRRPCPLHPSYAYDTAVSSLNLTLHNLTFHETRVLRINCLDNVCLKSTVIFYVVLKKKERGSLQAVLLSQQFLANEFGEAGEGPELY